MRRMSPSIFSPATWPGWHGRLSISRSLRLRFLWAEWLAVHSLGTSEWALRLLPYLAGVASLVLFWRFCREVASRRTVLLAIAVLAASFYPVRHSTEVKPYAIDLLVSLILISAGWSAGRNIRSRPAWLTLLVASTIGPWCSYTAIFPAAGVAMFLGARVIKERSIRLGVNWLALCVVDDAELGGRIRRIRAASGERGQLHFRFG